MGEKKLRLALIGTGICAIVVVLSLCALVSMAWAELEPTWLDRSAVVRMFDRESERSLAAVEAAIDVYVTAREGTMLYERIERNLFPHAYGLRNPDKLEWVRGQLVEDYGADSDQVAAWDAGLARFSKVE